MSRPLRIAYARFSQETHALSPIETTLAHFEDQHLVEGEDLRAACEWDADECPGFLRRAELTGFVREARRTASKDRIALELVPLTSAWAVPSGPLTRECFDTLTARITDGLAGAGHLDGVYLCLHGALGVTGLRDPETRLLEAVREVIGDDVPLATSYDLHANLTRERVALTDVLVAYRTNPHRDHVSTGGRAAKWLLKTATGQVKPRLSWRSLPMLLGGGTTIDVLPTMRRCFKKLRTVEKNPAVLDASLIMCHPYNSDPALGWASVVMTDDAVQTGERLAEEIADALWATKDVLPPKFVDPATAIARARKHKLLRKVGVLTISDLSDVVTTGTSGENPAVVKALLEDATDMLSYAGIRDSDVARELHALPPGSRVTVDVGAKLNPELYDPLTVSGTVTSVHEFNGYGKTVLLDLDHVKLVVTEGPALMLQPRFYQQVGLPMMKADLVMVKNFFPFLLFFAPYHRWTYLVKTKGLSDFDVALDMERDGPVHPRDVVTDWRDADRRRRLGEADNSDQRAAA